MAGTSRQKLHLHV